MCPEEIFFLLIRPASSSFVKMWPAYEIEFETPVINNIYRIWTYNADFAYLLTEETSYWMLEGDEEEGLGELKS